ncbi:leucine-rich repeat protein kinase family protein [Striga asiatica]|uniref:Leucine-rich repeat protein kinase family protein n=1 Tax=Striga asiatica TaxID=4170 RepID=A0A5A7NZP9_STRAF|nr:leucine-rich repeat protein kinase family protein [Striga asiatica]
MESITWRRKTLKQDSDENTLLASPLKVRQYFQVSTPKPNLSSHQMMWGPLKWEPTRVRNVLNAVDQHDHKYPGKGLRFDDAIHVSITTDLSRVDKNRNHHRNIVSGFGMCNREATKDSSVLGGPASPSWNHCCILPSVALSFLSTLSAEPDPIALSSGTRTVLPSIFTSLSFLGTYSDATSGSVTLSRLLVPFIIKTLPL